MKGPSTELIVMYNLRVLLLIWQAYFTDWNFCDENGYKLECH